MITTVTIATRYRNVVCPSVTLMHPAKAAGRNEMPFDRDTRVVLSNTILDRGIGAPVTHEKRRFGGWNPQFAVMPSNAKLFWPSYH